MKKLLRVIRVFDEKNQISLSNLAVWVVVVRLAASPNLDFVGVAALFTSLASYQGKRYLRS